MLTMFFSFRSLCVLSLFSGTSLGSQMQIWGVPPHEIHLYNPDKDFHCKAGGGEIPFSKVNDNYCDCRDGSDEPSTSACANGMFYCLNKGHVGYMIPSSRVNDGICDCCDGSDEYVAKNCENTCVTQEEEAKKEMEESEFDETDDDDAYRPNIVHIGSREHQERLVRLKELQLKRAEAEEQAKILQKRAEEAETKANDLLEPYRAKPEPGIDPEPEPQPTVEDNYAQEAFNSLDLDGDGVLDLHELKTEEIFDLNKNRIVEDKEIKWYYDAMPGIANVDLFRQKMWRKMGRLYVLEKEMYKAIRFEFQWGDGKKDGEEHKLWEEMRKEELKRQRKRQAEDTDEDEDFMEYPEGTETPKADTVDAVSEAVHLRKQLNDAKKKLKDIQKETENAEKTLNEATPEESVQDEDVTEHLENFGPDERSKYFPLRMHCYKYSDKHHLYRMCPFWGCSQQNRHKSGPMVNLGQWVGWAKEKGEPIMVFKKGAMCDNGVQRSVKVKVFCGAKSLLVYVEEPKMCQYRMEFKSPAGCHIRHLKEANVTITSHDEL